MLSLTSVYPLPSLSIECRCKRIPELSLLSYAANTLVFCWVWQRSHIADWDSPGDNRNLSRQTPWPAKWKCLIVSDINLCSLHRSGDWKQKLLVHGVKKSGTKGGEKTLLAVSFNVNLNLDVLDKRKELDLNILPTPTHDLFINFEQNNKAYNFWWNLIKFSANFWDPLKQRSNFVTFHRPRIHDDDGIYIDPYQTEIKLFDVTLFANISHQLRQK